MHRCIALLLAMFTLAGASLSWAQNYPTRPVRVVIPFPPGGNVDVFGRVLWPQVEKELIALAKQQPGNVRYSTAGVGNGQHLAGALFAERAGIDMLHVPYKGGGPAVTAAIGGEVQIHYPAPGVGIPHVKAGRLKGLGFTGNKRLAALPDVPTVAEAAIPGFFADAGWHGVFAPAKTPAAVVKKVQEAISRALLAPHVRDHFLNNGYEPQGHSPAEWAKIFRADLKRYAEITRIAKIEPQ